VALGDEAAEAPAEDDRIDEPQAVDEGLDVVRHARDGPEVGIAGVGAPVAAVVDREDPHPVLDKRVEGRKPHRSVEPGATVECDERAPHALLVYVELDVADVDAHLRTLPRGRRRR
jgi:hypothetical protein